jgi:hypothetical protein
MGAQSQRMHSTSARKKVSNIAVVELNSIDICKFIRFRAIKLIEKINIIGNQFF